MPDFSLFGQVEFGGWGDVGAMTVGMIFALIPAAMHVDAMATIIGINVLLWAMIAYETLYVYDARRYLLRHGVEIDMPGEQ